MKHDFNCELLGGYNYCLCKERDSVISEKLPEWTVEAADKIIKSLIGMQWISGRQYSIAQIILNAHSKQNLKAKAE